VAYGDRKAPRVRFDSLRETLMMGVDGSWRCECAIADISHTGARLMLKAPLPKPNTREFFLLLTPNGSAYRRCELVRVDGDTIGVRFVAARKSLGLSLLPRLRSRG
jgi:hypothetical protein